MGKNPNPVTAAAPAREIYEYAIPPELALDANTASHGEIKTVGLILLSPMEEKWAAGRCAGNPTQLAYELAQASLAEVNGKPVIGHDGSRDVAFGEMHPKIRTLVMQAYSEMAVPMETTTVSFLKSRRIKA